MSSIVENESLDRRTVLMTKRKQKLWENITKKNYSTKQKVWKIEIIKAAHF